MLHVSLYFQDWYKVLLGMQMRRVVLQVGDHSYLQISLVHLNHGDCQILKWEKY